MNILIVGGAVRDIILGKIPSDIDYMVQGASRETFAELFPEARQVGKDFPVFLVDGEEYAFARSERKTGPGHRGFSVKFDSSTTIEQDLERRDLTINSMAMCPESGKIVCVARSMYDINAKILRHTSMAFIDDPLRVFRVARFASQLPDFTVAEETIELMRTMKNELHQLPAERVFAEMNKALSSKSPRRFFEVLDECECLDFWFSELANLIDVAAGPDMGKHEGEKDCFVHTMNVISNINNDDPCLRFAGLCHDMGKALSENPPKHHNHDSAGVELVGNFCKRLKVPNNYKKSAVMFCSEHIRMHKIQEMGRGKAVKLIIGVNKSMHCGLLGFLDCSIGDGMSFDQACDIANRALGVISAKLPEKYIGRGKACADIIMQIRCNEWVQRSR